MKSRLFFGVTHMPYMNTKSLTWQTNLSFWRKLKSGSNLKYQIDIHYQLSFHLVGKKGNEIFWLEFYFSMGALKLRSGFYLNQLLLLLLSSCSMWLSVHTFDIHLKCHYTRFQSKIKTFRFIDLLNTTEKERDPFEEWTMNKWPECQFSPKKYWDSEVFRLTFNCVFVLWVAYVFKKGTK